MFLAELQLEAYKHGVEGGEEPSSKPSFVSTKRIWTTTVLKRKREEEPDDSRRGHVARSRFPSARINPGLSVTNTCCWWSEQFTEMLRPKYFMNELMKSKYSAGHFHRLGFAGCKSEAKIFNGVVSLGRTDSLFALRQTEGTLS